MATYTSPTAFTSTAYQSGSLFTQGWYQSFKDIRDAMVACGFVQTTDTGQQDFTLAAGSTTVPAAISNNSNTNYFIVRMNDTLQASKPIFIKISMRVNTNGYLQAWIIEIGTGTNGAGTITGTISTKTLPAFLNVSSTQSTNYGGQTQLKSIASGGASNNGSEFWMIWRDNGNSVTDQVYWSIERTKDENGTIDGEGVLSLWSCQVSQTAPGSLGAQAYTLAFPTNGNTADLQYGWQRQIFVPHSQPDRATAVVGNNVGPFFPYGASFFPKFRHSHLQYVFPWADQPNIGNIFTMPVNGVTRTFRNNGWAPIYYSGNQPYNGGSNNGSDTELQRWGLASIWE